MAYQYGKIIDTNGKASIFRITKKSTQNERMLAGKTFDMRTGRIFDGILKTIEDGAKVTEKRVVLNLVQKFLDDYVSKNSNNFGYNNYLGAVNHAYMAEVYFRGKRGSKRWHVSNKAAGPWGKETERDVKLHIGNSRVATKTVRRYVYMCKKRRHYVILNWKRKYIHKLHVRPVKVNPYGKVLGGPQRIHSVDPFAFDNKYKKGGRYRATSYNGLALNKHGQRLKRRLIKDSNGNVVGAKLTKMRIYPTGGGRGSFVVLKNKNLQRGKYYLHGWGEPIVSHNDANAPRSAWKNKPGRDREEDEKFLSRDRMFRYKKDSDIEGRDLWSTRESTQKSGYNNGNNKKTTIVIYNAAPFAGILEKQGYKVFPNSNNVVQTSCRRVARTLSTDMSVDLQKYIAKNWKKIK